MNDGDGQIGSMGTNTGAQDGPQEDMDRYLTNKASAFRYPPTPDIASSVRDRLVSDSVYRNRGARQGSAASGRQRRAWAGMALAVMLVVGALMAVPQVRGFVGDVYSSFVRIFKAEPGPVPVPNVPTATPVTPWVSKLYGETDFGNAQLQMQCPILLPGYPLDIGMPDHVFFQVIDGVNTVILVWVNREQPDRARMALYIFTESSIPFGVVDASPDVAKTMVHTQQAYWVSGTQSAQVFDSTGNKKLAKTQIVEGNVLIWTEGTPDMPDCKNLTYRLETGLSMREAVSIANSLQVPNPLPTAIPTSTPAPTTTPVSPASVLNLAGEQPGLLGLSAAAGFQVKIPVLTSKPDLIAPNRLYLQELGDKTVIIVWYSPGRTDELQMVLYQIKGTDKLADRTASSTVQVGQTTVHGNPAKWLQGPHMVYTTDNQNGQTLEARSFIKGGHALVWEEGGMTYRLETAGTMEEAVEIAEGLK
jgi:hypothetical protein